jgi:anti-sigma regulatory factor (Ser/Thr protein kinase)
MNGWLTAEQVEHIQWAVLRNRPVSGFVSDLRHATLPALLEYGCLRANLGLTAIPPLPAAIAESALGQSLAEIPSHLGLHNSPNGNRKPNRIDTCTAEFFSISTEDELGSDRSDDQPKPWQLYAIRFSRSAQAAGFSKTVADGLMGALYEMTRNALEHAESSHPALVGYQAEGGMALFCVVDVGRGILASLRGCKDYSHLTTHDGAISTALQEGTSRHGYRNGGLGFREVFRALTDFNGHLRFRSGDCCLEMLGNDCGPNRGESRGLPVIPGFQVSVCCRTRAPRPGDLPVV